MSDIQPTVLTTDEFINYCYQMLAEEETLPVNYQEELLRRYEALVDEDHA